MDGSIFPLYAAVGAFASSTAVACYGWHRTAKLAKVEIALARETLAEEQWCGERCMKMASKAHLLGFRKTLKGWVADAKADKRKHSHYLEEIDRLSARIDAINASWES